MSRRAGFHTAAWLAWLAATMAVALAIDNPFSTVVLLVALGVVAGGFGVGGPEGRAFRLMLRIGAVVLVARVVLFGLTGHTGDTTVAVLPELSLPAALGGFTVGGRVTAEVLAHEIGEGLAIAALLGVFGVFLSVVRTHEMLRMLPAFLHGAGVIVSVALAFVPTLLRTASDVRDAQRLRGHRFRGIRSLRALVVPVLAGALERSLDLAASMEARGFGRGVPAHGGATAAAAASLMLMSVGGGLLLFGTAPMPAAMLTLLGGAGLAASLAAMGRSSRTRWRAASLGPADTALIVVSAATVVLTVAARALPAARWYAYPVATWPSLDPALVALSLLPVAPAVIDAARAVVLHRASAANEDAAPDGRAGEPSAANATVARAEAGS